MKIGKKELILRDVETEVTDNVEEKEDTDMEKVGFIKRHWKGLAAAGTAVALGVTALVLKSKSEDDYDDFDIDEVDSSDDDQDSEADSDEK